MAKKTSAKNPDRLEEPSVVVRPLGKFGGLDSIHLSLILLVAIMAVLLLAVAYTNNGALLKNVTANSTQLNCAYGTANDVCLTPIHNSSQIKLAIEKFIASYAYINTSDSLLPYITNVDSMNLSYSSNSSEWYAKAPAKTTANTIFYLSFVVSDKNLSIMPFIQSVTPSLSTQNYVESYGVVRLAGKSSCSTSSPEQVYWFIDPYSPGSISTLANLISLESGLGSKIQPYLEILYTSASAHVADTYGINHTMALGKYLFCASQQQNFSRFASTLNSSYDGQYLSPSFLSTIANNSGLDLAALSSCIGTSAAIINRQAVLASYYNVTSTPLVVTDCQYQSIPQTAQYSLCVANSTLC